VVDYRGPAFASKWAEVWDVQMFNRIREIHFKSIHDPSQLFVDEQLSKLSHLEKLSVSHSWAGPELNGMIEKAKASISTCRIGEVKKASAGVELAVLPNSFSCSK
jgi:hypothetical protein